MSVKSMLEELAEHISRFDETNFRKTEELFFDENIQLRREDYNDEKELSFAKEIFEAQRHVVRAAYILRNNAIH